MKTKITIFITAITLLFGATIAVAQGTKAYFKKDGATVFELPVSNVDSIIFRPYVNAINYFPDAETVEVEYMGKTVSCKYVNGYYIMEGDIVVMSDFNGIDEKTPAPRAAEERGIQRWKNGRVYYKMSNNSVVKNSVDAAIKHYHANTNLKFIPVKTDSAQVYIKNYLKSGRIDFVADTVNESYVGMMFGTYDDKNNHPVLMQEQNLWLDAGCSSCPAALHEIGHAIGLMHEHSRSDRDNYIIVDTTNVEPKDRHNFDKKEMGEHSVSLEFGSIMMYPSDAFAINKKIPVIKKKTGNPGYMTQTGILWPSDIEVINRMYPKLLLLTLATPDIFIHNKKENLTHNSCVLTGEIIYPGEFAERSAVAEYGICHKESGAASYTYVPATNKNNDGVYTCQLTNLKPGTTYEACAYTKLLQNIGTHTGTDKMTKFTTKSIPVIAVSPAATSATATVTFDPEKMKDEYKDKGTPVSVSYCISPYKNFGDGNSAYYSNGPEIPFSDSQSAYKFTNITYKGQPLEPEKTYYIYGWVKFSNASSYVEGDRNYPFTTEKDCILINGACWATRNVGEPSTFVEKPEDYGGYYQWNRGTTDFLSYNNYYNSVYTNASSWLPANDPSPTGYRVPTELEMLSLLDPTYVTKEWTTQNGVNGIRFTDKESKESIFLPAAGVRDFGNGMLYDAGSIFYWSSSSSDASGGIIINKHQGDNAKTSYFLYYSGMGSIIEAPIMTKQAYRLNIRSCASDDNGTVQVRFQKAKAYTYVTEMAIDGEGKELASHSFGTSAGTSQYTEIPSGSHYLWYYYSEPGKEDWYYCRTYYFKAGRKYTVVCNDDGEKFIFSVTNDGTFSASPRLQQEDRDRTFVKRAGKEKTQNHYPIIITEAIQE